MSEKTSLICVTCPTGCSLEVTAEDGHVISVEGQQCRRGAEYAQSELSDPRRMVTTTVRIRGALHPLLPVHTARPFPKARILDLVALLRSVTVDAPINAGEVVLPNALDSGVDVVASRSMDAGDGLCAS